MDGVVELCIRSSMSCLVFHSFAGELSAILFECFFWNKCVMKKYEGVTFLTFIFHLETLKHNFLNFGTF